MCQYEPALKLTHTVLGGVGYTLSLAMGCGGKRTVWGGKQLTIKLFLID